MDHHRFRVDLLDRLYRLHNALRQLKHQPDITRIAFQIGRPQPAHAAHQRVYDRLVQRRVPLDQVLIPFCERGRITRDVFGIILIGEFPFQPERAAVVHEIDNRQDLQFLDHKRNYLVGPAPVEFTLFRFDLIPRHAPANGLQSQIGRKAQVFAPVFVMPHQLVFVERAMALPRLRNKCIFYAARPEKILRAAVK